MSKKNNFVVSIFALALVLFVSASQIEERYSDDKAILIFTSIFAVVSRVFCRDNAPRTEVFVLKAQWT